MRARTDFAPRRAAVRFAPVTQNNYLRARFCVSPDQTDNGEEDEEEEEEKTSLNKSGSETRLLHATNSCQSSSLGRTYRSRVDF